MPRGVHTSVRPESLKEINQALIIRTIVRYGKISRASLARESGLALPSIMRLVDDLMEKGLVVACGKGPTTGGRKGTLVAINADYCYIIGVEIASEVVITLTDFAGTCIASLILRSSMEAKPDEDLVQIAGAIEALLKDHHIDKQHVGAIGVGTPGRAFKHALPLPGFMKPGWESVDVARTLSGLTGIKVYEDNVARTNTLGEIWFGHGRSFESFLYVYVDWGVGLGLVNQGHIIPGANGVAGELGHMKIERDGLQCYCGSKGCLEMYVSVAAKDVSKESAIKAMALALGNLINLLNPPLIVLGGYVPRSSQSFFDGVVANLPDFVFHNRASETPILLSGVDRHKKGLGSVALVIQNLIYPINS